MNHGFRPFAKDLAKRLVTLAVLFLLVSNLAAFVSRRVPDEALLRQVGFSGGIVYSYPVSSSTAACILLDEAAGTVSFAVVGNDRSLGEWYLQPYRSAWWSRWTPLFRDVRYGTTVRLSDLELLQCHKAHYNETASSDIYCMEQDIWYVENGITDVDWLNLGVTRLPERLAGHELLFERQVGEAIIFCAREDEIRAIVTPEDQGL